MKKSLVVGANRGIGLELARQLSARGEEVTAVCRASSAPLEALDVRVEAGVDVTSEEALVALVARLDKPFAHVFLNAGILERTPLGALDLASIRRQFEVNALAPLNLAAKLQGHLAEGAKLALVTSRMGSIGDNTSGGSYGYRMSKAALNAAGRSLALDLRPKGIAVAILHPGYVKTDMTGGSGQVSASEAASMLIARLDELTLERTGRFLHANGEELPW